MTVPSSHPRPARHAEFRFYEELNDFLPENRRKVSFTYRFHGTPSVRDAIQALGVPHTAIDLVLVDGRSVDFAHRLEGGEQVSVYPVFERLDISPLVRLRPRPLRDTRFVADVHLGRLARYLRMLGFDTLHEPGGSKDNVIETALRDGRIILTRDVGILKRSRVTHGYWLRHQQPLDQLREVVGALDLQTQARPFTRCMECNGLLRPIDRRQLAGRVEEAILARFETYRECPDCSRVFWKGSHFHRMLRWVRTVAPEARVEP